MLDVYRKFYHFTGEPFRLGPDYRFSLHHSSYANAKSYLEYAIFQGEGFVTITGGPGTGKTTLISEILSVVDSDKIEVSTLTSTQVESRDLLHLVARSFGIESEDTSKANLLLEIESFLVHKIRDGQRAILIVDEAQGLSEGALEELRLLANLQYEYQLLLQIVLVGQEQLLDMIQQPAMEHLYQRMVAATSLEPLDFDETINYIEHRLSRVAWKGDPGIEEGALNLVYRYSGGVPRRINLIMNRLFLYGGMDEKHQYQSTDVEEVLKGLVEEFLLPPDPVIDEADLETRRTSKEAGSRPRYLPREPAKKPGATSGKTVASTGAEDVSRGRVEETADAAGEKDGGSGTRSADARRPSGAKPSANMDIGSSRRRKHEVPAGGPGVKNTDLPPRRQGDSRRVAAQSVGYKNHPANSGPNRKKGGKGLFIAMLLLAGAGSVYLLRDQPPNLDNTALVVREAEVQLQPSLTQDDFGLETDEMPGAEKAAAERAAAERAAAEKAAAEKAAAEKAAAEKAAAEKAAAERAAAEKAAAEKAAAERAAAERAAAEKAAAEKAAAEKAAAEKAAADKMVAMADSGASKAPKTGKSVSKDDALENRRLQLREDAEHRFTNKQGSVALNSAVPGQQASLPAVTKTTRPGSPTRMTARKVKQTLLDGRWSSAGKPASLLPSELTSCREKSAVLTCNSAPQNVKTQYGLALYKVETRLSEFSPEGHFELAYRTLVRMVDSDTTRQPAGDESGWQIAEYSMSCTLADKNRVSCLDGKGITREYRRSSP